jgi:inner membrane component-like transport protein
MSVLSLLLNIAWIVCGGLEMALAWLVAAVIMAITIIGIPWAKAAFNIAFYTLLPFGQKAVSRADYSGQVWALWGSGKHRMAGVRGMVAGGRPCRRSGFAGRDHHWHPICLGASQARRHRILADW